MQHIFTGTFERRGGDVREGDGNEMPGDCVREVHRRVRRRGHDEQAQEHPGQQHLGRQAQHGS